MSSAMFSQSLGLNKVLIHIDIKGFRAWPLLEDIGIAYTGRRIYYRRRRPFLKILVL